MYSRMVIGEAISEEQVTEFVRVYQADIAPALRLEPGFLSASLLIEEDGNMVVSIANWNSREACLRYHSSRSYRQFISRTQHLLLGDFVVKLFRGVSEISMQEPVGELR